jgi:HAE1 family hydrophobic/amphiphilic exporter-1
MFNKQSLKIDAIIIRLSLALLIFSGVSSAPAQNATPTPAPSPSVQPQVDDKQEVQPENLKGVPAVAPDYRQEDKSLPDLGRVGVDMLEQKPLSLKEAITLALENNKDIEVTRQNVRIAEFDLQSARGFYEPRFSGQTYYERATSPNVSIFSNNATTTNNSIVGNAGLTGAVERFGTQYNATVSNQRLTTNNPISILSPQNNTSFNLSVTQPLLRGRSFDQPRRLIEISKRNLSLTDTQFRQRSIEVITNVQRAYWDLVYSLRNLQVQRDGVRDAKEQLAHNRRLVEEGQLAPIDIVAAETQVANIEQGVYEALESVGRAENTLKNLIAPGKDAPIWRESIVPTDSVDLEAPRTNLTEALTLALENRPEIEINNVQRDINELDQRFFREQTKPQIDLTASYTTSGVGGAQNPNFSNPLGNIACNSQTQTPEEYQACVRRQQQQAELVDNLTGSSISDVFANRYPTFRAGVTFNLPLFGDKTAKANLGRSRVQSQQITTQREQLEQSIQVDVRNALQSIRTAEARLRAAAISRENSQKQYESEQRKLDAGQTDVYKVLERQTALIAARSNELRAQTELNKAIADLQRATGNSLKANNVEARLRK